MWKIFELIYFTNKNSENGKWKVLGDSGWLIIATFFSIIQTLFNLGFAIIKLIFYYDIKDNAFRVAFISSMILSFGISLILENRIKKSHFKYRKKTNSISTNLFISQIYFILAFTFLLLSAGLIHYT